MGLTFTKSSDHFEIGRHEDICANCVSDLSPSDRIEQVGKLTGKRIYKNQTPQGGTFCLCQDCLAVITKGLK